MNDRIEIESVYELTINGRAISHYRKSKSYRRESYFSWKDKVARIARNANIPYFNGRVGIDLVFYDYDREALGDLDNVAKGVLDALAGIFYQDDRQVDYLLVEFRKSDEAYLVISIGEWDTEQSDWRPVNDD